VALGTSAGVVAEEWLELGRWVLDPSGAGAALATPVVRRAERDVPLALGPWTWQPLCVPAHPRGGVVEVEGPGAVAQPWAEAGRPLRTLAGCLGAPCTLRPGVGGPVGRWSVRSAQGFGQVYGARGVAFLFKANGRLEIQMADAFVGPAQAAAMAERMGTSGTATGTWRVAGPHQLRFGPLDAQAVTMHGHERGFVLPASGFGMGALLQALQEDVWTWALDGDRLVLQGHMMGGGVDVRLVRE
jgi:hypothetical protein